MIKIGSIRFVNISKSAEDLSAHVSKGIISFSLAIQRGDVWELARRSEFILNIIEGGPTFPIYVNKVNGIDYVIDGQQRLRTTSSFINNQFKLSKLEPIETLTGESINISGKRFKDLDKPIRDTILMYAFAYNHAEDLTDEQVKKVYIRLNSGRPLSPTEMTKAQIKSIAEIKVLGQHDAFKKIISTKGLEESKGDDIAMQIYTILFESKIDLLSSKIRKRLKHKDITDDEQNAINKCLDMFCFVYDELSKDSGTEAKRAMTFLGKKTHMVAFIFCINKFILDDSKDVRLITNWIKYFFNGDIYKTSINEEYNDLLVGGTNKRTSVDRRHDLMYQSFSHYKQQIDRSV